MTDMEYLYGLRGIRYGLLSIEYSYSRKGQSGGAGGGWGSILDLSP